MRMQEDKVDESYVLQLCSELGTHSNGVFVKNEERCLKCLRRLRREINLDMKTESYDTGKRRIV